jgi:hypothetical protein
MPPAHVDPELIVKFPAVEPIAADLLRIGEALSAFSIAPVVKGSQDVRAISWRCKSLANAALLRGDELMRISIHAINEGANLTALILARALDETLASVVCAQRKITKAVESNDVARLTETLDRLTCGNRYMSEWDDRFPKSYNVMSMIDETDQYIDELLPAAEEKGKHFRTQYDFASEMAHPSMGSFSIYQRLQEGRFVFDRDFAQTGTTLQGLLSNLQMAMTLLALHAERLAATPDLPEDWPERASAGR